jgi:hypothetical protein
MMTIFKMLYRWPVVQQRPRVPSWFVKRSLHMYMTVVMILMVVSDEKWMI